MNVTSGTHDFLSQFHVIAVQITHKEDAVHVLSLLDTVRTWVLALYGEDFFENLTDAMADMGLAIAAAFNVAALRHVLLHNCHFHMAQLLNESRRTVMCALACV